MTILEFVELLTARGFHPVEVKGGWMSRCPAHEDKHPSLSIREGSDGRVLVKCHANCDASSIVSALGLSMAALFTAKREKGIGELVATYDYVDEIGNLLFQVVRYAPKNFRQRRPDPSRIDGWTWSTRGIRQVPFHLPAVIDGVREGRQIWIVEGEKDALCLSAAGFVATTNAGGAGKWQHSFSELLRGAEVLIVADRDTPGRDHAKAVAESLFGCAICIRILECPSVKGREVKDVGEFLEMGGTPDELLKLANATKAWAPLSDSTEQSEGHSSDAVPCIYDSGKRSWWTKNGRSKWIELNETAVKRLLKAQGYGGEKKGDEPLSALDSKLLELQRYDDVAYAGPLAGWKEGIHEVNSDRILVTSSPILITPKEGEFSTIRLLLWNMLGETQYKILLGWLKFRRIAVLRASWRPSQAIAFCGPARCGKSLTQQLITWCLGGREAGPWRYMSGGTNFNGELFGAEHLSIQDQAASTDIRARRQFGCHIKSMLFTRIQSCHGKGRQAVSVEPHWSITISVNAEPENLMVLPPLDESLKDKLTLLKCELHPMPMPTASEDEKNSFEEALCSELPAFLHAVDSFEVPPELAEARCGVSAYQHPDILRQLNELAPEAELLSLIDDMLFRPGLARSRWEGTAADLERVLRRDNEFRPEVERLLYWRTAAGTYLHRLERAFPNRFIFRREPGTGQRLWRIEGPNETAQM